MMDGVWLIDTQARTTFVNRHLTQLLDMTEQDMMGKTIFELVDPADVDSTRIAFAKRSQGEKTTTTRTLKLINGKTLHIRFTAVPIYDRAGKFTGALAVLGDISETHRMEEQLRHNEERYRTIFENVNDIIYAVNEQGKIESLNPAFTLISGWKIEDWIGRSVTDLIHPEDRPGFTQNLQQIQTETISSTLEARMLTASDRDITVEIKIHPIDKDGVRVGYTGVARDVTTRQLEALQELQVALEYERLSMLNRFIRNASHDLRTPLSIINSSAYLVRRKLPGSELQNVMAHLDSIENQVMHLNEQINNLFTISDDFMDMRAPLEQHDLNGILAGVVYELTPATERKHQQITFTPLESPAMLMCNPGEMQRAVRHILVNASNYTLPKGKIDITISRKPGFLVIEIQDNGIGIDPDQLTHIFEPFYRVDQARNLDTGGMGLGLTITRAIVEGHGGQIDAVSTLGEGTTFTLSFPITLGSKTSSDVSS
jgi:PAS domain S-box-containing protein